MAIDPRIALAARAPDFAPGVTSAINIFETVRNNAQARELNQAQGERAAALAPFQLQAAQQGVASNKFDMDVATESRVLKSINDFAVGNASLIQDAQATGDPTRLRASLVQRRAQLINQGLPTETTDDSLALIDAGNMGQVISGLGDAVNLFNQGQGKSVGTASQRDFQTFQDLNLKAQQTGDPADVLAAKQFGIQSGFGRPTAAQAQEQAISKAQELADISVETSRRIETEKSELSSVSAAKKLAVTKSGVAFDKLANIDVAMGNFDDAIKAIDEGAQTGTIISKLPSFRKSSIELDNIQKSLGLDVVSNTTFGALSESELAFALSKALPKNLKPEDLKVWLQSKKAVQQKLRDHISEAAQFLGTGENTIPDWIELQKAKSVIQKQQAVTPQDEPATDNQAVTGQFSEGQTATGPSGERAVFTNGQWVVQ
jgi:hypothetical protein